MHDNLSIPAPFPTKAHPRIFPVFIPFAGCPHRCVFCSQNAQTGTTDRPLDIVLTQLEQDLTEALNSGRGPYELAFYGGTFTALPKPWPERFLALAKTFRDRGLICRVRCSTRPDAVEPKRLDHLKSLGLDMIELGIQSFDDHALTTSGRGYDAKTALAACQNIHNAGLGLGIQLLPGLPGDHPGVFQQDTIIAAANNPQCVRLYPCVVMDGTPLAKTWREGGFIPWSLEKTIHELAKAMLVFDSKAIPVIRLGLAPEPSMNAVLLDGPWHPAIGQSIRALALLRHLTRHIPPEIRLHSLILPERFKGELFGHKGELKERYAALGLGRGNIHFESRDNIIVGTHHPGVDGEAIIR